MKYRVLRQHYGDRAYTAGEERELRETDGKRLVELGVLEEIRQKKAPEPENKMQSEPENKARKPRKSKSED